MFLHFSNGIIILLALISIYVTNKSSSHFSERYINNKADRPSSADGSMRYTIGTFDLENWCCELRDVQGASMVREDYARQCALETAGRTMMIPFLIAGWALAALSIWQMIGGARDADGERMKTDQVEMEMGKMNAL